MTRQYHRALMAFPIEDVVIGSRLSPPMRSTGSRSLTRSRRAPARGRRRGGRRVSRLAKRFGVEQAYDEEFHRHRRAADSSTSSPRRPRRSAPPTRRCSIRSRRRRLARRVRMDDGRGPGQARQSLTAVGSSSTSETTTDDEGVRSSTDRARVAQRHGRPRSARQRRESPGLAPGGPARRGDGRVLGRARCRSWDAGSFKWQRFARRPGDRPPLADQRRTRRIRSRQGRHRPRHGHPGVAGARTGRSTARWR